MNVFSLMLWLSFNSYLVLFVRCFKSLKSNKKVINRYLGYCQVWFLNILNFLITLKLNQFKNKFKFSLWTTKNSFCYVVIYLYPSTVIICRTKYVAIFLATITAARRVNRITSCLLYAKQFLIVSVKLSCTKTTALQYIYDPRGLEKE